MLVVISPAKRLDWSDRDAPVTMPRFSGEAARLAAHARQLTLSDLKARMGLSDALARLNRDRFRAFSARPEADALRPAALAFAGDTYAGLEAASLDADARLYAGTHLRILSGLYGVLRPFDGIQPYRLEMGTRMKTRRGETLYSFWGPRIAQALRADAEAAGSDTLVNCASREYFDAVDRRALGLRIVTPLFYEDSSQGPRIVSFFAKKARGAMARFIVENRVTAPEGLRDFTLGGYRFSEARNDGDTLIFLGKGRAAAA